MFRKTLFLFSCIFLVLFSSFAFAVSLPNQVVINSSGWVNVNSAFDGDFFTNASKSVSGGGSGFIGLNFSEIDVSNIKWKVSASATTHFTLYVLNSSGWVLLDNKTGSGTPYNYVLNGRIRGARINYDTFFNPTIKVFELFVNSTVKASSSYVDPILDNASNSFVFNVSWLGTDYDISGYNTSFFYNDSLYSLIENAFISGFNGSLSLSSGVVTPNVTLNNSVVPWNMSYDLLVEDSYWLSSLPFEELAYFTFNKDVDDLTSNGNDGVLNGYSLNDGILNGGVSIVNDTLVFDGVNGYVNIGFNSFNVSKPFTLMFNLKANEGEDSFITQRSFIGPRGTSWGVFFDYNAGQLRFLLGNDTSLFQTLEITNTTVFSGNYNHITGVYDGSYAQVYLNGDLLLNESVSGIPKTSSNFEIARDSRSDAFYSNISVKNLRIIQNALNQSEIQKEMVSDLPVKSDGLVLSIEGDVYNSTHVLDTNWRVNGTKRGAISFNGVDEYVNLSNSFTLGGNGYRTLEFWVNPLTVQSKNLVFGDGTVATNRFVDIRGSGAILLEGNTNNQICYSSDFGDFETGWSHIVIIVNSSNLCSFYLNGVSLSAGDSTLSNNITLNNIGRGGDGSFLYFNGSLDDVHIYNRSLSSSEVLSSYLNSAGKYEFLSGTQSVVWGFPRINITAINLFNGSNIDSFTTTVNGVSATVTDGDYLYLLPSGFGLYNISINTSNYFSQNLVYNASNVYQELQFNLSQSQINVELYEKVTNNQILNFTAQYGSQSDTTTNGTAILYLNANNNQVINLTIPNYYNNTISVNVNALDNKTVNKSDVYDVVLNVSLFEYSVGSSNPLVGFINLSFYNFTESFNSSNPIFNLTKNTYSFYVNGSPNLTQVHSRNYNNFVLSSFNEYRNVTLFRANSLWLNFKNIITNDVVNNVNLTFLGTNYYNFSINSSPAYIINVSADTYELVVSSSGFADLTTSISTTAINMTNRTIYLSETTSTVSLFVKNIFDQYLSGVSTTITRASDGALVFTGSTDASGGVTVSLYPSITYNLAFSKAGYDSLSDSLKFADSTYTYTLELDNYTDPSYYSGFSVEFAPSSALISNGSVYDMSSSFESTIWAVSNANFTLYDGIYTINQSVPILDFDITGFSSSSGSFLISDFNASLVTSGVLTARLAISINSTTINYYKFYYTDPSFEGSASLVVALNRLAGFDEKGFGDFERLALSVLFMSLVVFGAASSSQFLREPERVLLLLFFLSLPLSYFGFLDVNFGQPEFSQWIVSSLIGVVTFLAFGSKWRVTSSG